MRLFSIFISLLLFSQIIFGQEKQHIAVVRLDVSGISDQEGAILTDRLINELFATRKFTVLEREKMEEILKEQEFQLSGCTSTECMMEVGKLVGVQAIVGGSVGTFGSMYTINIRLIDVETGSMIKQATFDYQGSMEKLLTIGMKQVALQLAGLPALATDIADETSENDIIYRRRSTLPVRLGISFRVIQEKPVIQTVEKNSIAEGIGLLPGDIIVKVNGNNTESVGSDFISGWIQKGIAEKNLVLTVNRNGSFKTIRYPASKQDADMNTSSSGPKAKSPSNLGTLENRNISLGIDYTNAITTYSVEGFAMALENQGIYYKDKTPLTMTVKVGFNVYFPKALTKVYYGYYFVPGFLSDDPNVYHTGYSEQVDAERINISTFGVEICPIPYFSFGMGYATTKLTLKINENFGAEDFNIKKKGPFFLWKLHFTKHNTPFKIGIEYNYFNTSPILIRFYNLFLGFNF
ncbi:MAG: hypothetical protein Kow00108_18100 [Calditrichia bacterium]